MDECEEALPPKTIASPSTTEISPPPDAESPKIDPSESHDFDFHLSGHGCLDEASMVAWGRAEDTEPPNQSFKARAERAYRAWEACRHEQKP